MVAKHGYSFGGSAIYGLGFGSVQPALQAWSVAKSPNNRRGMANATFFSFFDLGVGTGAMTFGQIAHVYGYNFIYLTGAFSVIMSMLIYIGLLIAKCKKERAVQ